MKKIICIMMALVMTCLVAAGCSAPEAAPTAKTTVIAPSAAPETASAPAPAATPSEPAPSGLSLTTGLASDKEYKPFVAMIENSPAARPQTGVQQADIVYEVMAEGSITRFLCLFNDNLPVKAGPIRSTRLYYISIQREWDAPLIHYGGPSDSSKPSYVYGSNSGDIRLRLDGLKGGYSKYFWRDSERKAPHNVYTDLTKFMDLYDYTPKDRTQFTFDPNYAPQGDTVDTVGIPFSSKKDNFVEFRYNAATDKFERYMSGVPFEVRTVTKDENGNDQTDTAILTTQNIIVQYAKTYLLSNDVKGRKMVDTVGEGKAEFFIGGKHLTGTWARESEDSSTVYTLDDGTPVTLKPGNTWICMQPTDDEIAVTYNEGGSSNVQGTAENTAK